MQWLTEHHPTLLALIGGGVASAGIVGWWVKSAMQRQYQQLEQELELSSQRFELERAQLQQRVSDNQRELDQLDLERDKAAHELKQTHGKMMAMMEKLRHFETLRQERERYAHAVDKLREEKSELSASLREQEARHEQESKANTDKLRLLEQAEERLKQQFEQLANQLFDSKTAKVDQQNRISLEGLLSPLKEQLEGFKKQVNDSFNLEAKERHTLVHELHKLQQLNERMTTEAVNLTNALKGDNKQQGNWGEVVLARVLAESGLREGHEYTTQTSLKNELGKRYQPDVIVNLPQGKQVIIDAKMTLVAYERYFNASDDSERGQALSEHLLSVRGHIKGLGQKDYHQLQGVESLDYVLMFIPVEPAFQVAIEADPSLVSDAFDNNILLVSPTTLLVALRTIDNLWRNDRQNQNAKQIAERAARLYDKLRLFVDDMEGLGGALDKANQQYQGAMNKLATGRGNAIRQAESFKQLGVEIKRPISQTIRDNAVDEQDAQLTQAERQAIEDKVN